MTRASTAIPWPKEPIRAGSTCSTPTVSRCGGRGTCVGILDLLDTVVQHTGFFAFHFGADGRVLQRVFGPAVLHAYSIDVRDGLAVGGSRADGPDAGGRDVAG